MNDAFPCPAFAGARCENAFGGIRCEGRIQLRLDSTA